MWQGYNTDCGGATRRGQASKSSYEPIAKASSISISLIKNKSRGCGGRRGVENRHTTPLRAASGCHKKEHPPKEGFLNSPGDNVANCRRCPGTFSPQDDARVNLAENRINREPATGGGASARGDGRGDGGGREPTKPLRVPEGGGVGCASLFPPSASGLPRRFARLFPPPLPAAHPPLHLILRMF
jgi:hypothetical protein